MESVDEWNGIGCPDSRKEQWGLPFIKGFLSIASPQWRLRENGSLVRKETLPRRLYSQYPDVMQTIVSAFVYIQGLASSVPAYYLSLALPQATLHPLITYLPRLYSQPVEPYSVSWVSNSPSCTGLGISSSHCHECSSLSLLLWLKLFSLHSTLMTLLREAFLSEPLWRAFTIPCTCPPHNIYSMWLYMIGAVVSIIFLSS